MLPPSVCRAPEHRFPAIPALLSRDTYEQGDVSLSKHRNRSEPYARLGFASSGKDLKDDFLITLLGEEVIGTERTLVLELTPKRDDVRQVVGKITLWIDEASWMPVRQVIEHVAGQEQLTINYTGTARNLNLNPDLFRSSWPRGTKQVRR